MRLKDYPMQDLLDEIKRRDEDARMRRENTQQVADPSTWMAIKYPNARITDPDGWRGSQGRPYSDPIVEEEFDSRLALCTIDWGREVA